MLTEKKADKFKKNIEKMKSVIVAFSGGVDSAYLLKTAKDVLGDNAAACTVRTVLSQENEVEGAVKFAEELGVKHFVVNVDVSDEVMKNPLERCYLCKKRIFSTIKNLADIKGIKEVVDGTNKDDMEDYRPGMKALKELNVKSPLLKAGLTKNEVRLLAKRSGLKNWDKPAMTCFATRFPYGQKISEDKIKVLEKAEAFIKELGISQLRVRCHEGSSARIEVPRKEMKILYENREMVSKKLKKLGFKYVSMDMDGYKQGALNEGIRWKKKK